MGIVNFLNRILALVLRSSSSCCCSCYSSSSLSSATNKVLFSSLQTCVEFESFRKKIQVESLTGKVYDLGGTIYGFRRLIHLWYFFTKWFSIFTSWGI